MQGKFALGGAVALVAALSLPAAADDDVKLRDVPAAVRATIERETRGGKIEDIERKVNADKSIYYEVEWEKGDEDWELHVGADGKVQKHERD